LDPHGHVDEAGGALRLNETRDDRAASNGDDGGPVPGIARAMLTVVALIAEVSLRQPGTDER